MRRSPDHQRQRLTDQATQDPNQRRRAEQLPARCSRIAHLKVWPCQRPVLTKEPTGLLPANLAALEAGGSQPGRPGASACARSASGPTAHPKQLAAGTATTQDRCAEALAADRSARPSALSRLRKTAESGQSMAAVATRPGPPGGRAAGQRLAHRRGNRASVQTVPGDSTGLGAAGSWCCGPVPRQEQLHRRLGHGFAGGRGFDAGPVGRPASSCSGVGTGGSRSAPSRRMVWVRRSRVSSGLRVRDRRHRGSGLPSRIAGTTSTSTASRHAAPTIRSASWRSIRQQFRKKSV